MYSFNKFVLWFSHFLNGFPGAAENANNKTGRALLALSFGFFCSRKERSNGAIIFLEFHAPAEVTAHRMMETTAMPRPVLNMLYYNAYIFYMSALESSLYTRAKNFQLQYSHQKGKKKESCEKAIFY